MDGNLYFAKKQQIYKFNEFTRTVTEADKFNINVLNVEYSKDGLLQQMQDILGRLIRSSNIDTREIRRRRRRKGWKDKYNKYYNSFKQSV